MKTTRSRAHDLAEGFRLDGSPADVGDAAADARRSRRGPAAEFGAAFDLRAAVGWLDQDQRARVAVDAGMNVLWANPAARSNLRPPMPVYLADGKLCFGEDVAAPACRDFVRSAGESVKRRALVSSLSGDYGVLSVTAGPPGSRAIYVRVAVAQPVLDLRDTGLIDQFGLTRAEGDVAQHLAHLRTPTVIARELGLSVNTVRTHIRRIYAKLSINSQMQFARLVHTFAWA